MNSPPGKVKEWFYCEVPTEESVENTVFWDMTPSKYVPALCRNLAPTPLKH